MVSILLSWYSSTAREFFWRRPNVDPWVVLVSEVMLQQTQTSRVEQRLPEFIDVFPTPQAMAEASAGTVLKMWSGMGYNRRALRLQETAVAITKRFAGRVPGEVSQLLSLPGVGPYTSAAVACFAFGRRVVVLDVNVRRVYTRLSRRCETTVDVDDDDTLTAFAESVIPHDSPSDWHHAVMDLGATICTARRPQCPVCPLQNICPSAHVLQQVLRPKKQEPSWRGHPRRIWRGRIIEFLRLSSRETSVHSITTHLFGTDSSSEDVDFIQSLLTTLSSEGMIVYKGQKAQLVD